VIRPTDWRPAGGLKLEPNALRAVQEQTRNLALTAGPGAGKTEMLAQRADFLLRTGLCPYPQRILAISFKVDASRNLKDRVRERCDPALAARLDSHTFHGFAKRLIDRFRPVLTGINELDADYTIGDKRYQRRQITFQDMVPLAIEILDHSEVARNAVRQTYSHVFMDEFQDCTDAQYKLLRKAFLASSISLTAVGDTKQRIMGWAGALEGIFQTFAKDFDVRALNLYQNFRSQPRLRRMQNAMVKVMEPAAAVDDKELTGDDGKISILEYEDSQQEAREIAANIRRWIDEDGIAPSSIAVLLSKQPELYGELLMLELTKSKIPYRNEQKLQDLSAEPVCRLIVDFLSVIVGQREPDAYRRLMDILEHARNANDDRDSRARCHRFLDHMRAEISKRAELPNVATLRKRFTEFLAEFGQESLTALSADYEQGDRLQVLIDETFERLETLLQQQPDLIKVLASFSEDSAVRVMTIHKSKGLEFDTVVMLGIENQTFFGKIGDERAAYFVGISRAKRVLVLTNTSRRSRPTGYQRRWDEQRTPQHEFLGYAFAHTRG
jgi:superfamily I DNA/RNA helicase